MTATPTTETAEFFLGVPEPAWLATTQAAPLFVSHTRLRRRKNLPRAAGRWALDSGGFTELRRHGAWTVPATTYASAVRRYRDDIGQLAWAAPQDWMCEPDMQARTGLTVEEHQRRTIDNYLELRSLAPDLPFIPVLQGWVRSHYLRCRDMYAAAGIDLTAEPLVGLGSVCRRQAMFTTELLIDQLHWEGLTRLHGFGVKLDGLAAFGHRLTSADSQAWSFTARAERDPCPLGRRDCRNCQHFAEDWAADIRGRLTDNRTPDGAQHDR